MYTCTHVQAYIHVKYVHTLKCITKRKHYKSTGINAAVLIVVCVDAIHIKGLAIFRASKMMLRSISLKMVKCFSSQLHHE